MKYKGYEIQKTYGVINPDRSIENYFFTLAEAKECIDELKKEALK